MPWLTELAGGKPPDPAVQVKATTKDALECQHLPVIQPQTTVRGARCHTASTPVTRFRKPRRARGNGECLVAVQMCVTNEPAQNDGLVRVGRAVAKQAGEQQGVASGYARLPRTAET